MKVRIKKSAAGPVKVYKKGAVLELNTQEAMQLIKGGIAELYETTDEYLGIETADHPIRLKAKPKAPKKPRNRKTTSKKL